MVTRGPPSRIYISHGNVYIYIYLFIGRAGASLPCRTSATEMFIYLFIYLYIYDRPISRIPYRFEQRQCRWTVTSVVTSSNKFDVREGGRGVMDYTVDSGVCMCMIVA